MSTAGDAVRLALGTLTVLPVAPPRSVDRRAAGRAMLLAPLVGALLAVVTGTFLWLLGWGPPGGTTGLLDRFPGGPSLVRVDPGLAAALTIGLLAVLTRGMHLDGLADTADGLGSGREQAGSLEVMRRGDVGPFGVVTLVLVLLIQVLALGALVADGAGIAGLAAALVVSRLALPLLCRRGVPGARAEGLGSLVAGSVSRPGVAAAVLLAGVLLVPVLLGLPGAGGGTAGAQAERVLSLAVAAVAGLGAALLLARRARRRLGGITGDVLGAAVEAAFTATLVALTLG